MVQIEPGLGLLMYRDGAGEDARALVGADVLGVQGVAEEHLPGGHPGRPFGDDHLGAVGLLRPPPGADGEDALLDSQADGLGGDARQVEVAVEGVALAAGVHGQWRRAGWLSRAAAG